MISQLTICKAKPYDTLEYVQESRLASIKDAPFSSTKSHMPPKSSTSVPSRNGPSPSEAEVTEDELRDFLRSPALLTTHDLVARFKGRIQKEVSLNSLN